MGEAKNPGPRVVRIGEASHVGPRARRRRRVRSSSAQYSDSGPVPTLLDDVERDVFVARPEVDFDHGGHSGMSRSSRVIPLRPSEPSRRYHRLRSHVRGTQADVSSDKKPPVRPNNGRHVVPRIAERHEEVQVAVHQGRDTLLDDQSRDVANREPCATVAASPGALLAAGALHGAPPAPTAGGISENRFFHLVTVGYRLFHREDFHGKKTSFQIGACVTARARDRNPDCNGDGHS